MAVRRERRVGVAGSGGEYLPPMVISLHGIRTAGRWQKDFAAVMSADGMYAESFNYGSYGVGRFLIPGCNQRKVDAFYRWYGEKVKSCREVELECYDRRPSVVAHSFGTWIVGQAMLKFEDIRFDKMVLAGSVLPRDFDWGTVFARDQVALVRNECGQKDPWPGWAKRLVAGTGTAGCEGFEWWNSMVENHRCEFFGHSDGLMRTHIEAHWRPFLQRAPSPMMLQQGREIQDREQFAATLNHCSSVIDQQAFGDKPFYPEAAMPRGLSLEWVRMNPDIYTFLVHRETRLPTGYINAIPLRDEVYAGMREGRLIDNEVTAAGVLSYEGQSVVKVYLMSIAIEDRYRRWGDGIFQRGFVQLMTGFLDKLRYYAQNHGCRVTHFLASAWTDEGRSICECLGMRQVGTDRFKNPILELDLEKLQRTRGVKMLPAMRKLLHVYAEMGR